MPSKKSKPTNGNGRGRKNRKGSGETVSIPLRYEFADDLQTRYANNMMLQYNQHEYIMSFFEVHPPIAIADSPEELQQQLEQTDYVQASCVSRIVVASGRMPSFVAVMLANLKNNAPNEFSALIRQAQISEDSNE